MVDQLNEIKPEIKPETRADNSGGESGLAGGLLLQAVPGKDAAAENLARQANGKVQEGLGNLPTVELVNDHTGTKAGDNAGDQTIIESLASADDRKMFTDLDAIARRSGAPLLTEAQKLDILTMDGSEKEMYRFAITELEKLADNKISPADYMSDNLHKAASLAEANGRTPGSWNIFKPTSQELYVNYVAQTMCDHSLGLAKDAGRAFAGSPISQAGMAIEERYSALIKNRADQGFNPNVVDTDKSNSVTHHYREVLMVGYNSGIRLADWATEYLDKPDVNPGDVRNGYFAAMLGSALWHEKITPTQAADLTTWAYRKHDGVQPPWGNTNQAGNYLDPKDYYINPWIKAYRDSLK